MLACAPLAASGAPQRTPAPCPLEIVGTWRLTSSSEAEPMLLSFSPQGWVAVLSGSAQRPPGEFDIAAQVPYQLVPRRDPKRIEFRTRRGNDVFPPGASSWEITAYTDESFSARRVAPELGEQSLWSRLQTQRYFLTFAARDGTPARAAATFVMWTTLDGNAMRLQALGTTGNKADARFGRISDQLTRAFAAQRERSDDEVMLRLEVSEAEYRRIYPVFEAWDVLVRRDLLPRDDPQGQVIELVEETLRSVNRCGAKLRLVNAKPPAAGDRDNKTGPQRRPQELVRTIRKINDDRHVPDRAFPLGWKPSPVS